MQIACQEIRLYNHDVFKAADLVQNSFAKYQRVYKEPKISRLDF